MSATDPDATIVNRGKPRLSYQVHRAVDVNEAHRRVPLLERYHSNTGRRAEVVVADSQYGTIDNFWVCSELGVKAHVADLGECSAKRTEKLKIFSEEGFEYDPQSETYRCPGGNRLKPRSLHQNRQSRDYAAPKELCAVCTLREQCTRNKSGRTIKRHLRQEELDRMRESSRSAQARRDIKMRQHLMEPSYARGTRYGFDRARWRGLWRVQIQEYLIATIQNLQVLVKYGSQPKGSLSAMMQQVHGALTRTGGLVSDYRDLMIHEIAQWMPAASICPWLSRI